jgi:hypothetical protein
MHGARRCQLIRVIVVLGSQCFCIRERMNQEKSFIVSGQLPLWNPLALVSLSLSQVFQGSRPPASAIWPIRSCCSIYLLESTMYLCCSQSFYIWCPLCCSRGYPFPWTAVSLWQKRSLREVLGMPFENLMVILIFLCQGDINSSKAEHWGAPWYIIVFQVV